MPRPLRYLLPPFLGILCVAILSDIALAQSNPIRLVSQRVDDNQRVTLKGNVHPMAQPRFDQGTVSDSFPAERMLLLFQRSPERRRRFANLFRMLTPWATRPITTGSLRISLVHSMGRRNLI